MRLSFSDDYLVSYQYDTPKSVLVLRQNFLSAIAENRCFHDGNGCRMETVFQDNIA